MFRVVAPLLLVSVFATACICPASETGDRAFVRISSADARYFELSDGTAYIPIGLNAISPGGHLDTREGLAVVDRWFSRLAENGGNFARVWLSSPFWDVEHRRSGVYDEEKAARIDGLFRLARKHGIRLKLTLEHFREIDPGSGYSRNWALKPLHHVSRGGPAASIADWFDGEAAREIFQNKLDWYAKRYGDDPIVFGWELWNEVNAVRGGDYMAWTGHMLGELDERFPENLVMQSLGSFDRDRKREQYRRLALMPGNEVAQVHRYLDLGAEMPVCHGPVDVLAAEAVRELLAVDPGRPVLLAESGAVEPNHTGPFHLYDEDKDGIILHDVLFAPFFAGSAGTGHCWHWNNYVDANGLWWQFGRFARAIDGIDPAAEGFEPRMIEHDRLRVYCLAGRRTTLLWCRDKQNTWKSELAEGRPPQPVRGSVVNLEGAISDEITSARTYNPWEDQWQNARVYDGALGLPTFKRSVVVRLRTSTDAAR